MCMGSMSYELFTDSFICNSFVCDSVDWLTIYTLMTMTAYKFGLVLFMISLCWSSELYPASENPDDVQ